MANSNHPPALAGLSALAGEYRFLLCDVWGVVHNGAAAIPETSDALSRFRERGGIVVLLTNAPRRKGQVVDQLDRFGVPRGAYDDIVTSGEATRTYFAGRPGEKIFHLGPDRDLPIYEGLDVALTDAASAAVICCTGLFDDETETPDTYTADMEVWRARGLAMVCANPDLVVERGARLVWCAGALAERYAAMGGKTIIFGKPHGPVYATALARLSEIAGKPVEAARVLAVGDGLNTDIRGANQANLDVLFVTGGIHAEAFGSRENPDARAVHAALAEAGLGARAYLWRLAW
ncbi:MAG TPA: TIGR01459 family HAD-type hydrolase [Bauldia sp.]|nr:TIGR01459 family HAD-type hydrolase [Bauldia sp.]